MVSFLVSGVFWVIFWFWAYFGHFMGSGDILVIFRVSIGNFGHFMGFGGYFVHFLVSRVFQSFLCFGGILVILYVS